MSIKRFSIANQFIYKMSSISIDINDQDVVEDIVELLKEDLDSNKETTININRRYSQGKTPLMIVICSKLDLEQKLKIIQLMLKYKDIDIEAKTNNGFTALGYAYIPQIRELLSSV